MDISDCGKAMDISDCGKATIFGSAKQVRKV